MESPVALPAADPEALAAWYEGIFGWRFVPAGGGTLRAMTPDGAAPFVIVPRKGAAEPGPGVFRATVPRVSDVVDALARGGREPIAHRETFAALTKWFEAHTLASYAHGKVRLVEPSVVVEVAFDRVQPSSRHKSGYALRFPRIVRVREDKPASEADTLEAVRRLAAEPP